MWQWVWFERRDPAHLQVARVVETSAERREVAHCAQPSQSVTFDPNCSLGEVKVGGVRELEDKGAREVAEPHRETRGYTQL